MPGPLSSVVMTPIEEQQAMQDYVRQRLAMGLAPQQQGMLQQQVPGVGLPQQPGMLQMPQQPLPGVRPPVLGAGGPPPTGPGGFPPGAVQLQGDIGGNTMQDIRRQGIPPVQAVYRKNIPF